MLFTGGAGPPPPPTSPLQCCIDTNGVCSASPLQCSFGNNVVYKQTSPIQCCIDNNDEPSPELQRHIDNNGGCQPALEIRRRIDAFRAAANTNPRDEWLQAHNQPLIYTGPPPPPPTSELQRRIDAYCAAANINPKDKWSQTKKKQSQKRRSQSQQHLHDCNNNC